SIDLFDEGSELGVERLVRGVQLADFEAQRQLHDRFARAREVALGVAGGAIEPLALLGGEGAPVAADFGRQLRQAQPCGAPARDFVSTIGERALEPVPHCEALASPTASSPRPPTRETKTRDRAQTGTAT